MTDRRADAQAIWQAGVDAVRPAALFAAHPEALAEAHHARRILVVGGGKAGSAMAEALETALADVMDRVEGLVNVPADTVRQLRRIECIAARPAGSNHPTAEGVAGTERMLALAASATTDDVIICLLSGGGSALLPAPTVPLADKQTVTKLLHAAGATINEMNAVRKHLSRLKGGGLVRALGDKPVRLISLIISDVIGDPLDVIASGPTAPDPTTFAECQAILTRYRLDVPESIHTAFAQGTETLKSLPHHVTNIVLGNNAIALAAAAKEAERRGYAVSNLGDAIDGDTQLAAREMAVIVEQMPQGTCLLSGGETTVTLSPESGKGGRNQEFALALLDALPRDTSATILCGGTDGEDGPTDAAGAVADGYTHAAGLDVKSYLARHDAYSFFDRAGGLLRTGPTQTNVMDLRVILR